MKTAQQRLAEIERQQILLTKKLKAEEIRKTTKVGQFVREHMPDIEKSQAFLDWLSTDIDRTLFGAPSIKNRVKKERPENENRPKHVPSAPYPNVSNVKTSGSSDWRNNELSPELQEKVNNFTNPPVVIPKMTGGAGDRIRAKMLQDIGHKF